MTLAVPKNFVDFESSLSLRLQFVQLRRRSTNTLSARVTSLRLSFELLLIQTSHLVQKLHSEHTAARSTSSVPSSLFTLFTTISLRRELCLTCTSNVSQTAQNGFSCRKHRKACQGHKDIVRSLFSGVLYRADSSILIVGSTWATCRLSNKALDKPTSLERLRVSILTIRE